MRLFISITLIALEYVATCFDPHLGHLQAHILHKISHKCMLNLHVDRSRTQSVLQDVILHEQDYCSLKIIKICSNLM